jgi:hypothetical protein
LTPVLHVGLETAHRYFHLIGFGFSAKAIPALRDSEDVMGRIARRPGVVYTALVTKSNAGTLHQLAVRGCRCVDECAEFF